MPRFFDDYSNTYLTHDSAAGRKQQRRGWKFRENFKLHYLNHVDEWRRGPMGLASAQEAYIKANGVNDPMIPPLPDGWNQEQDDVTGIMFYVNNESGERTWVRPQFFPPPPGPPQGMIRRGPPPPPKTNNNMGGLNQGGGFQQRGPPRNNRPPFQHQGPPQQQQQQQQYAGHRPPHAPPPQQQYARPPPQSQFQLGGPPPPPF